MALAHRVDTVGRRLTIVGKRTCTFESILDMLLEASAERRWQPEFAVLIDLQSATVTFTNEGRPDVAALLGQLARRLRGRVAWVTTGVGQRTPAALMAMMMASTWGIDIQVFSKGAAALQWLDAAKPPTAGDEP